jgi:hypothetical protein
VPASVVAVFAPRTATRSPRPSLTSGPLKRVIAEHGGVLQPAQAGPQGDEASHLITVPDMARANALASALREVDGIETAYAKPGEELP